MGKCQQNLIRSVPNSTSDLLHLAGQIGLCDGASGQQVGKACCFPWIASLVQTDEKRCCKGVASASGLYSIDLGRREVADIIVVMDDTALIAICNSDQREELLCALDLIVTDQIFLADDNRRYQG